MLCDSRRMYGRMGLVGKGEDSLLLAWRCSSISIMQGALSSCTARLAGSIDLGVAMDILTFTELTTPDERSLRFTPLGLATGGKLSPEKTAEFQQRSIATADLVPAVPE